VIAVCQVVSVRAIPGQDDRPRSAARKSGGGVYCLCKPEHGMDLGEITWNGAPTSQVCVISAGQITVSVFQLSILVPVT
jgi:hypothetical protein